jgi:hypothetical protein
MTSTIQITTAETIERLFESKTIKHEFWDFFQSSENAIPFNTPTEADLCFKDFPGWTSTDGSDSVSQTMLSLSRALQSQTLSDLADFETNAAISFEENTEADPEAFCLDIEEGISYSSTS